MKKWLPKIFILFGILLTSNVYTADLVQVYQQAFVSDPTFQRAIFQRCSTKEGVPISLAALLPTAGIKGGPYLQRTISSGDAVTTQTLTAKGYDFNLAIRQSIFDVRKWANLAGQFSLSKEADASLNAALQDLIVRVASAYFAVLNDEDNLRYTIAAKEAYAKQLEQVTQQFKVGLKTITDVYTARASYESSQAEYITALNTLQNDRENLRVITGVYYPNLAKLSEAFPLVSPCPADMELWVRTAGCQNWSIRADQYAADAARQNIKQQFAGALPTLDAEASYDRNYNFYNAHQRSFQGFLALDFNGSIKNQVRTVGLALNVPIVQGGLVIAQTRRAQFDYQVAIQRLELTIRNTFNTARQSFLGVISGISKVKADREAILSNQSSLEGLRAQYEVGTATLIDVLIQQQQLFRSQKQYATDRYSYVNNLLALKQAAGTLSICDLEIINRWLVNDRNVDPYPVSAIPIPKNPNCHCFNKNKIHVASKKAIIKTAHLKKTHLIKTARHKTRKHFKIVV